MNNQFNVVIGIEVHVVVNSQSKMFSSSKNSHSDIPNTNISPIDLGHPGTMPLPNKNCISKGIVLARALNMQISDSISFDRKNYFYQDLPKGFQITQQYNPIGRNGKIQLSNNCSVDIERIHLEEDTAKQFIEEDGIYLDYNRSGLPLIEIVTNPVIKNGKQAVEFLKKLKSILLINNISDAKLEDGSMRADINISVNHKLSNKFGTRVEIKNINSFSNVEKAIDFEINRQIQQILLNNKIEQETRKFNDKNNQTEFMRKKTDSVDYHYMIEPNIYFRPLNQNFIDEVIQQNYIDVDLVIADLEKDDISKEFINMLLDDIFLYRSFIHLDKIVKNKKESVKWLCNELMGILSKNNKNMSHISYAKLDEIGKMINYLLSNKINGKQAKEILKIIYETNKDLETIIDEKNFKQITDEKILSDILNKYIKENQKLLDEYDSRPERVEKFFIGMVMKDTNGQANPDIVNNLFKKIINK